MSVPVNATHRPPAVIFGVPVADITMEDTIDRIGVMVERGRRDGATHQIATANVDFLVKALGDESLASILREAQLCLPDGMPLVWAAHALGMPMRERVAGSDLVPLMFERCLDLGWRVHVLGSRPEVAARAEVLLAERCPGATVTFDPGPMVGHDGDVAPEIVDALAAGDIDILCVALGNPKQERFISRHRDRLGIPVMIGIGGSIDMWVGERKRAPVWMQRVGLEWVARAFQEPVRLGRRYVYDLRVALPRFVRDWRGCRRRRNDGSFAISVGDQKIQITIAAGSEHEVLEWHAAAELLASGSDLEISVGGGVRLTDVAIAELVGLARIATEGGGDRSWIGDVAGLVERFAAQSLDTSVMGID